jgi:hypothetical protein
VSLAKLIADRLDVRQGFASRLPRPQLAFARGLQVAPPKEGHPLVSGAFGYLLRFRLQRINAKARAPAEWTAEAGAALIGMGQGNPKAREATTVSRHPRQLRAAAYVGDAKRRYQAYINDGRITEELLVASYRMSHLDNALVRGPEKIDWRSINYLRAADAADLKALLELVDDETFRAARNCILDPRPVASELVGGGAPDFILDHCVVDVNTTHEPKLDVREYFRLVGYYLLLGLGGIGDENGKVEQCPVTAVGVYFARFGQLWKVPIREIVAPDAVPELTRWFAEVACAANPGGLDVLRGCRGPLVAHVLTPEGALIPAKKAP